ncbi:MAG: DUF664 domain-containing protein [Aeromicrobium sp.]
MTLPEPDGSVTDPVARIVEYLDHFRAEVRRVTADLDAEQLSRRVVPSAWSAVELVEHLVHMERRWIIWGFLGEHVVGAEADRDDAGHWTTDRALDTLLDDLDAVGRRTAEVAATHDPLAAADGRGMFADRAERPTLFAILFHVMQEYARHAGHLDIARELIDGVTADG